MPEFYQTYTEDLQTLSENVSEDEILISADEARQRTDKANSLKIHPLCQEELKFISEEIAVASARGMSKHTINIHIRPDTIEFLRNKGYKVSTEITGLTNKTVYEIEW